MNRCESGWPVETWLDQKQGDWLSGELDSNRLWYLNYGWIFPEGGLNVNLRDK